MLWAITNNIYRNNVAFVENIWEKIITTMIAHRDNNVERYLIFIKNNLQMIHSKSTAAKKHNGLITYILHQLKLSTNPMFLCFIQDLHIQYQEAKLLKLTPMQLVLDVEDKIRVLKHADLWATTAPETPAMALAATTAVSDQLKEFLANHITAELTRLMNTHKNTTKDGKDSKSHSHFTHQDWMFIPPPKLSDTKVVNN